MTPAARPTSRLVAPPMPVTTAGPVLQVRDLQVTFPGADGGVRAVRGVDLDVTTGSVHAIVGESGCGKSATAAAVMGLLPPTARAAGSVRLDGHELMGLRDRDWSTRRGADIAMIFQDPLTALTPVLSIGDQVVEAVRVHDPMAAGAARRRAAELLDLVGLPDPVAALDSYPHELSGGMRQRVAIAMAVAHRPRVIIADEPTTALDTTVQAQVLDVLRTARRETGAAIVLITHDLGVVAGIADHVSVMYAGRVVESAPTDTVFAHPRMPYTVGLLGAVPRIDRRVGTLVPVEGTPPTLHADPVGCPFEPRCPIAVEACRRAEPALAPAGEAHEAACLRAHAVRHDIFPRPEAPVHRPGAPREERPALLRVHDLRKDYPLTRGSVLRRRVGTVSAVAGVDLDVRAGECLAVVGESGCGKSTLLHQIAGLGRVDGPVDGRIEVFGRDVRGLVGRRLQEVRGGVQLVFQDASGALDPRQTVGEILAEPLEAQGVARARRAGLVADVLRTVGLPDDVVNRFPAHLSGGQRQRVCIARAVVTGPRLLLLDEPVSALDVSVQAGIVNLLTELTSHADLASVVVAHDLALVRHLADRVAVMHLGDVVEVGSLDAVFASPRHPYTRALLAAAPVPDPVVERDREHIVLVGDLPSPRDRPAGCSFASRCPVRAGLDADRRDRCDTQRPGLVDVGSDHAHACFFPPSDPAAAVGGLRLIESGRPLP